MRREIGILLTLGGVGLIWLFKKTAIAPRVHTRFITLREKKGTCGIDRQPEDVVLRKRHGDVVRWVVTNPENSGEACNRQVTVCIGDWNRNNASTEAPVADVQGAGLCRDVSPSDRSKRITAVVRPNAPTGYYYYSVLIDGTPAVDPMVEIVV